MSRLIIAIFVAFLAACSTFYKEPDGGMPSAKMRFATTTDTGAAYIFLLAWESEECKEQQMVGALSGIFDNHRRKNMGLPLGERFTDKHKTEILIPANKPFVYSMGVHAGGVYTSGYKCWVSTKFDPKENKIYEAVFTMGSNSCSTVLNEIAERSGQYERIREESARGLPKACGIK